MLKDSSKRAVANRAVLNLPTDNVDGLSWHSTELPKDLVPTILQRLVRFWGSLPTMWKVPIYFMTSSLLTELSVQLSAYRPENAYSLAFITFAYNMVLVAIVELSKKIAGYKPPRMV